MTREAGIARLRAAAAQRTQKEWRSIIAIIPHHASDDWYATTPWVKDHQSAGKDLNFIALAAATYDRLLDVVDAVLQDFEDYPEECKRSIAAVRKLED